MTRLSKLSMAEGRLRNTGLELMERIQLLSATDFELWLVQPVD